MSLVCDLDPPEFFSETIPKARKDHKCCECNLPIRKGTKYWYCSGMWEGQIQTFKQHIECRDACYKIQIAEECIPFGALQEWLGEYSGETWYDDMPRKRGMIETTVRSLYARGKWASRLRTKEQISKYNLKHSERKT